MICSSQLGAYVVSVLWILDLRLVNAYSVDCSITQCHSTFVNCAPFEDCFISCIHPQECAGSLINCPVNGNCDIQCLGDESCYGTTIDATLSSGTLNVLCGDHSSQYTNHCNQIKIFGSTLRQNTGDFIVQCIGNCIHSDINCAFNSDCHIYCDADSSCVYSKVTGPIFGDLTIQCNADTSCSHALFNGAISSTLSITGCHAFHSCLDLTLYCPSSSDNGDRHCFIEGNDNLGVDKATVPPSVSPTTLPPSTPTNNPTHVPSIDPTPTPTNKPSVPPTPFPGNGLIIYAVNGWKDIKINYTGTFSDAHGGKMYCGDRFDVSCDLAMHGWSCDNIHHHCNNGVLYKPSTTSNNIIRSETPTVSIESIEYDYSSTEFSYTSNTKRNADLFILICIASVGLTCIGVGCAQIRKSMIDEQKAVAEDQYRAAMHKHSASFRRQRSLSSKNKRSASIRHQHSASIRDKQPHKIPGWNDYDSILL